MARTESLDHEFATVRNGLQRIDQEIQQAIHSYIREETSPCCDKLDQIVDDLNTLKGQVLRLLSAVQNPKKT